MNDDKAYSYSKLVDEAIDALPTIRHPHPNNQTACSINCPVLEDPAEGALLVLAIVDQLELSEAVASGIAKLLGVSSLAAW